MEAFLAWENMIFFMPVVCVLLYIVLFAFGLADGKDLDADGDVNGHIDHDHDFEHGGVLQSLLSILGIGRVPLSVVIMSAGLLWGFTGYACNKLYGDVWFSMGVAAVVGLVGTVLVSSIVARLIPKAQSFATNNQQLVSHEGAVLHEVSQTAGTVRVLDKHGHVLDLPARVRQGESSVAAGVKVRLAEYDSGQNVFFVTRCS
jgi:membrane protein implicated in regulation of membrane protease activity